MPRVRGRDLAIFRGAFSSWSGAASRRAAAVPGRRSSQTSSPPGGEPQPPLPPDPARSRLLVAGVISAAGVVGSIGAIYGYLQQKRKEAEEAAAAEAAAAAAAAAARAVAAAEEAAAREKAAKEAAAREAALEARRRAALEVLGTALAGAAGPSASDEALEALRSAVRGAERGAEDLGGEVAAALSRAGARLLEVERARRLLAEHGAACTRLSEAVAGGDADACRRELGEVEGAEAALREAGETATADPKVLAEAHRMAEQLEREERRAALLAEKVEALEVAVTSRSAADCARALEEACEVGVEPCPSMQLARILAEPQQLHTSLVKESLETVNGPPCINPDLSVEDFASAAQVAAASMDEGRLQERAAELVGAIIRNHFLHAMRVEGALPAAEAKLSAACSNRGDEALQRLVQDKERARGEREARLEEAARLRAREAAAAAVAPIAEEAEERRHALRLEAERAVEEGIRRDREETGSRIGALAPPLSALEHVAHSGSGLRQRSQASNALSGALLALEGALQGGRPSGAELAALQEAGGAADAFVLQILAQVPAETMARSSGPVPTEPQLQRSFKDQLGRLTAAALAPPPAGLLGSLGSRLVGRLLGSAYALRAAEWNPEAPDSPTKAAQQNLLALSRAAALAESGDLRAALGALEELTGECRRQTRAWAEDARHALLLRQAARAVQAKACCLHAVLL